MQMRSLAAKYCVGNNYGKTKSLDNAVNTDLKHSAFKHWQSIITANVISRACRRKKSLHYSLLLSHCSGLTQF